MYRFCYAILYFPSFLPGLLLLVLQSSCPSLILLFRRIPFLSIANLAGSNPREDLK
jgi:hypothetical protein